MNIVILAYVIFVILCGAIHTALLVYFAVKNRRIASVTVSVAGESDAEYLLRTALFKYPNATVIAEESEIADMLIRDGCNVTTRQAT